MPDYKTAEEKAAEWNITSRHVQYLCRMGKIEGAVKRAGVWFIPSDSPIPLKNTKSGVTGFQFVGTKSRVFDSAIKLFMENGFNSVSLSDIAEGAGIRQSTIYNHFRSKQEILDTIYEYFHHYYLCDRPAVEELEPVMRQKSVLALIEGVRYSFKDEYRQRMSGITKIIFQRIGIDARARDIAKQLMVDEGMNYVETVFNRAVELGELQPLNTHLLAVFVNALRIFTLYNWIVDPSDRNMSEVLEDEVSLYNYVARILETPCAAKCGIPGAH